MKITKKMTKRQIDSNIAVIRSDISELFDQCDDDQKERFKDSLVTGLKDINVSSSSVKDASGLKFRCRLCNNVSLKHERLEHVASDHLDRFFHPVARYKTIIEEDKDTFDKSVNDYCEFMESQGMELSDFRTIANTSSQNFMAFILFKKEEYD